MMLPGGVAVNSVRFEMESWICAQSAFAVKSFYKNNDSYVAAQREFRKKFGIHRNSMYFLINVTVSLSASKSGDF
jgi:hypothetical protein